MIEWREIPTGILPQPHGRIIERFSLGKYPVTNAQYMMFVDDGGYREQRYWTAAGWIWREAASVTAPGFWDDPHWHIADHPVVGVLWHEAIAFCHWLSSRTGETITLPNELQRERAARGDEGLSYPWGEFFDETLCNSAESGIGRTTPVDHYPGGKSAFDVFDLSGNVWEWCRDTWDPAGPAGRMVDDGAAPALRGGSFYDTSLSALCEIRARYRSDTRLPYVGFRVARI